MSAIHFVHEIKPGSSLDSEQVRALRSHVRKVNLERLNQRRTRRLENFRSLTVTDFSQAGSINPSKSRTSGSSDPCQRLSPEIESPPMCRSASKLRPLSPVIAGVPFAPSRAFESLSAPDGDGTLIQCGCTYVKPTERQSNAVGYFSKSHGSGFSDRVHPSASQISKAVQIDAARVDHLLHSCKRSVALRSESHTDSEPHRPFPHCG